MKLDIKKEWCIEAAKREGDAEVGAGSLHIGRKFTDAVRAGDVPGVSIDPDNPAMQYEPMAIDAPAETKVRFTGHGGYDSEQARARELLTIGATYTIERTEVGGWRTDVYLKELPGKSFNSVMFEEVR